MKPTAESVFETIGKIESDNEFAASVGNRIAARFALERDTKFYNAYKTAFGPKSPVGLARTMIMVLFPELYS
jgi:hypothetical protein